MKIILATQGSQGVVALRELFSLGYSPHEITVAICESNFNATLWEFINFNQMTAKAISCCKDFSMWIDDQIINEDTILLSISWKYKFSKDVLRIFGNRAVNLHPGLLPEYRGCFSTPWAIINDEKFAGYTFHIIEDGFDLGPILLRKKIRIKQNDTAHSLGYRVMQRALSKLDYIMKKIGLLGCPQEGLANYFSNEVPFGGQVDPAWSHEKKMRFARALYFPPHEPAYEICGGQKKNIFPDGIVYE